MTLSGTGDSPRHNPCAQCGQPIETPEWVEPGPSRVAYVWHCRSCDYRFEAIAFFDTRRPDQEPLAA